MGCRRLEECSGGGAAAAAAEDKGQEQFLNINSSSTVLAPDGKRCMAHMRAAYTVPNFFGSLADTSQQ